MKNVVLTLVLSVFCIGNVSAQKWLKSLGKVIDKAEQVIQGDSKKTVTQNDKQSSNSKNQSNKADYTLAEVQQVDNSVVATPVDLGLSVQWASKNLGAVEPFQYGGYYDRKADYISQYWGEGWRLPTEKEWEELFTKCKVKYVTAILKGKEYMPDIAGYLMITGPNGNKMWLPAAGFKNRPTDEELNYGHGYEGYYWAFETRSEYGSTVYSRIFFQQEEKFRYYPETFSVWGGASIRPVYVGKEERRDNVPANVFSGIWEPVSPDESREVAIELTPEGKKDEFSEMVVYGNISTVLKPTLQMDDDVIIGITVKGDTAYLEYECLRTGEKGRALLIYDPVAQTITLKVTEYPKAEYDGCYAEDCIFKKTK